MNKKFRIAAIGDIHVGRPGWGPYTEMFTDISEHAEVLLLCGDLTALGTPEEASLLAEQLRACTIPVIAVLGNHDHTGGKQDRIKHILKDVKVRFPDDEPVIIDDVVFEGVKGFCGGFGEHLLGSFGEEMIKKFVQETLNEALALENQLSNLGTERKIVLMHYAPIRETLIGEPEEIFPFLGSSRFMEPIDTFSVTAAFHGHAHYGTYEGKTLKGIPVYNVAYPIMQKKRPDHPYALIEI
jgi:Icc-related predicted phosphoesterase